MVYILYIMLCNPLFLTYLICNPDHLAVDESTDVCDNAQLLVYVRFFNKEKKESCEVLL